MNGNNKYYDLVCSLGGNCSAAHNLLKRGLRKCSYPFDWTYFTSDEAVYQLAEGFKNKFKDYMLKENLVELPINPEHADRIQYEDKYGKIIWANHFSYYEDREKNYNKVKKTFDKRFKRLLEHIQCSKKILFIFSPNFYIKPDSFERLLIVLKELYPDKEFEIKVISFDSPKDDKYEQDCLEIFYIKRKAHLYDFLHTSFEWDFLDNIALTDCINYKKKRHKISFKLFGYRFILEWNK
jgi:hypothetical protein